VTKVTFHYAGQTKTVEAAEGQSVLKIALDHAIPMEHACGGNGFCTTCLCQVKAGMEHLNERNDREENMGVTMDPYRLGCQTRMKAGDGEVEIEVNES
jgi:2Fe-2S ferredoxin